MKNKIDFLKLDNGKLGAINFNNMLPVNDKNVILIDLNKKITDKKEKRYQKLLKEQIYWLNRNNEKLYNRAEKIYNDYINNKLNKSTYERCCNFRLLEEKCIKYNK